MLLQRNIHLPNYHLSSLKTGSKTQSRSCFCKGWARARR